MEFNELRRTILSLIIVVAIFAFTSCIFLPGEPIDIVFRVEYSGDWIGNTAVDTYYTDEDVNRTEPAPGTKTESITGSGITDIVASRNATWFYIRAEKADEGVGVLTVQITSHNRRSGIDYVMVEDSSSDGAAAAVMYTGFYDVTTGEALPIP